jgi:CheY-like chemotaxis protein
MNKINEQDLLKELRFDIKVRDLLKAKLVLSHIEKVSERTQKLALFELSRAEDDFAIPLLAGVIANSPKVSESFPQLRKTLFSKVLDNPQVVSDLLAAPVESSIRGVLAEVAGEIRLKIAVPGLLDILTREKTPEVIKSVINALGMIGDPSAVEAINEYLYAGDNVLIETAASALSELATPLAVKRLAGRLGTNADLDGLLIDMLAKIQIPEAIETLNETLASQSAHLRTAGKQKLGEIGTMSVRILTKNLLRDNPDLVIHSLNVLGDIGDGAAIPAVRKLLFNEPKDPNIRFAAYETMGRLPIDKGAYTLAAGLEDPVDNVRSAAAKAIDRNFNSVLAAGVRNLTRSADTDALAIMAAIINAQCDNIVLSLLDEEALIPTVVEYLSQKAHPSIRSHYAGVLSDSGHNDLAGRLSRRKAIVEKATIKVFAVDDSTMILNIYRTVLHNLGCESELFEFPAVAIEKIKKEKPDVVLTDLNMPDITGIDLTRSVRQHYMKDELPIIMVTTQDEAKDNRAARDAGVNGILQKPFTEGQIGKALKQFTGIKTCS